MTIDAIGGGGWNQRTGGAGHMGSVLGTGSLGAPSRTAEAPRGDVGFGEALKQALDGINQVQAESDRVAGEFQLGNPSVSVEQVMVALNRANMAFQGAVQVRNRLVAAYNEVMNMPV